MHYLQYDSFHSPIHDLRGMSTYIDLRICACQSTKGYLHEDGKPTDLVGRKKLTKFENSWIITKTCFYTLS